VVRFAALATGLYRVMAIAGSRSG